MASAVATAPACSAARRTARTGPRRGARSRHSWPVTTGPDAPEDDVFVDWGAEFRSNHHAAFQNAPSPVISINHGPLALDYILAVGGSGYFRMEVARPHLETGRLRLLPEKPRFSYSIYALYSPKADERLMERVRNGLRAVAGAYHHRTDGTDVLI